MAQLQRTMRALTVDIRVSADLQVLGMIFETLRSQFSAGGLRAFRTVKDFGLAGNHIDGKGILRGDLLQGKQNDE